MKTIHSIILLPTVFVLFSCKGEKPVPADPPAESAPASSSLKVSETTSEESEAPAPILREAEKPPVTPSATVPAAPKVVGGYPVATTVPGKPGFVFNPYNHRIVDVTGIGPGKIVRDPADSDPTHKFRLPAEQ